MDASQPNEPQDAAEPSCRECRHNMPAAGKRTGGIFTWYCQHGVCYAFYVIPHAEGRNEAFSFLTKYFKIAPRHVIYDFACALEEYCLNRAPHFFKETKFSIDNFHFQNHRACAQGYAMPWTRALRGINSQIAEQGNSALQRIKPATASMLQSNFMRTVRLFLHGWNTKKVYAMHQRGL